MSALTSATSNRPIHPPTEIATNSELKGETVFFVKPSGEEFRLKPYPYLSSYAEDLVMGYFCKEDGRSLRLLIEWLEGVSFEDQMAVFKDILAFLKGKHHSLSEYQQKLLGNFAVDYIFLPHCRRVVGAPITQEIGKHLGCLFFQLRAILFSSHKDILLKGSFIKEELDPLPFNLFHTFYCIACSECDLKRDVYNVEYERRQKLLKLAENSNPLGTFLRLAFIQGGLAKSLSVTHSAILDYGTFVYLIIPDAPIYEHCEEMVKRLLETGAYHKPRGWGAMYKLVTNHLKDTEYLPVFTALVNEVQKGFKTHDKKKKQRKNARITKRISNSVILILPDPSSGTKKQNARSPLANITAEANRPKQVQKSLVEAIKNEELQPRKQEPASTGDKTQNSASTSTKVSNEVIEKQVTALLDSFSPNPTYLSPLLRLFLKCNNAGINIVLQGKLLGRIFICSKLLGKLTQFDPSESELAKDVFNNLFPQLQKKLDFCFSEANHSINLFENPASLNSIGKVAFLEAFTGILSPQFKITKRCWERVLLVLDSSGAETQHLYSKDPLFSLLFQQARCKFNWYLTLENPDLAEENLQEIEKILANFPLISPTIFPTLQQHLMAICALVYRASYPQHLSKKNILGRALRCQNIEYLFQHDVTLLKSNLIALFHSFEGSETEVFVLLEITWVSISGWAPLEVKQNLIEAWLAELNRRGWTKCAQKIIALTGFNISKT